MPNEIIIPEEHLIDINTEKCHICGVSCSGAFPILSLKKGMVFICGDCDDGIFNISLAKEESRIIETATSMA